MANEKHDASFYQFLSFANFVKFVVPRAIGTAQSSNEAYSDERRFKEVTFLGTHNSFASRNEGWLMSAQLFSPQLCREVHVNISGA